VVKVIYCDYSKYLQFGQGAVASYLAIKEGGNPLALPQGLLDQKCDFEKFLLYNLSNGIQQN
jgi:hypothetical protein